MTRFKSARNWAKVETKKATIAKLKASESSMVLKAYECCIVLLAQIAGEEIPLYEQYRRLEKIQKIVYQATAAAIDCAKLDKAVEFFEEGRSVIWKHYFKHDVIMQALENENPKLAKEWSNYRAQLRAKGTDEADSNLKMKEIILGKESPQSSTFGFITKALERVGSAIKQIAEFTSFGLYQNLSLLDKATEHGSIILINLYNEKCDALILQKKKPVTHVRLPKMSSVVATRLQKNLKAAIGGRAGRGFVNATVGPGKGGMGAILKTLWETVAEPIVESLEVSLLLFLSNLTFAHAMCDVLSRVPLHATAIYSGVCQAHFHSCHSMQQVIIPSPKSLSFTPPTFPTYSHSSEAPPNTLPRRENSSF